MSRRPALWLLVGAAAIVGGFVAWLQIGLVVGAASLGSGAGQLQGSLSAAADSLASGGFEQAQQDFAQAAGASDRMVWSADLPQVRLLASLPAVGAAGANWQSIAAASDAIVDGTGDSIDLFGDLSGNSGSTKIFANGAINIGLLEELPPRVARIERAIKRAGSLLQQVDASGVAATPLQRVTSDALDQVDTVQGAMTTLGKIIPLLPGALGADGPRRYLVAICNQAEMRASGGAPLSLVLVEFNDGRITIPIKGTTSTDLFPPVNRPVEWWGPALNPFFPSNPRNAPFVVANTHPNLLYSAKEMAGAWEGGDFPKVDGVITIDLTAIAAVLDSIGPIESPEYGTVTGEKLGEILLVEAYQQYGQEEAATRQKANQQLLDELLTQLLSGDDLVSTARAVASTAPGRHFQVWMRDTRLEDLALGSGAGGDVAAPPVGDWSAVYTQNGNQSKVDVFQQRNVLVTAQLALDGSARVTQQVTVTNATPPDRPDGPPERIGYETSWAKNAYIIYVPDEARDYSLSYPQGFAVRPFRNHEQYGRGFAEDGFGQKLVRVVGWTPPGGQSAVSVSYSLPPGTFSASAGSPSVNLNRLVYRLQADPQATWNPSTITVRVTAPSGWIPLPVSGAKITDDTIEVSAVQDAPVAVRLEFERSSP